VLGLFLFVNVLYYIRKVRYRFAAIRWEGTIMRSVFAHRDKISESFFLHSQYANSIFSSCVSHFFKKLTVDSGLRRIT